MKALAIAGTSVRRMFRDRTGLFFIFLLPTILILVIGVVFGGGFTPRVGLVVEDDGEFTERLVATLEGLDDIAVRRVADTSTARRLLERGDLEAALLIPAGFDGALRTAATAELEYLSGPGAGGFEIQSVVQAPAVALAADIRAAHFATEATEMPFEEALTVARALPGLGLTVELRGEQARASLGQFDLGATQQLVLFMFVTSLAASGALIQSRRLGVSRRMLSTPTSSGTVVVGETLGRFGVAMVQGLFILVVGAVAFGVDWGDPIGAGALVIAFALVGTGAGMLVGSTFQNDDQAGGIGTFLGLGLGALGGCMVPLEVFSPTMRDVAHVTPHAWALDGFATLIRRDGGVGDVLGEVGVLLLFAAGLLVIAAATFRRSITR